MRKIGVFFVFLILILCLPSIQAEQESLGSFQVNECVELKQICASCTFVNVSQVLYPNSSVALDNSVMVKDGSVYTKEFCNTSVIGQYIVNGLGDVDGTDTVFAYDFQITPNGFILSTSQGIVYIVFALMAGGLFIICLWGGIKIPYKNPRNNEGNIIGINDLKYVKIFLLSISYLLLLFIVGIMRSILANFLFFDNASRLFEWVYWSMLYSLFPIFVVTIIVFFFQWLGDKKLLDTLQRGLPFREVR